MNDLTLVPNKAHISAHLSALFSPAFVHPHPDAWIEIAYGQPDGDLDAARNFSVFDLEKAVEFAVAKNAAGNKSMWARRSVMGRSRIAEGLTGATSLMLPTHGPSTTMLATMNVSPAC